MIADAMARLRLLPVLSCGPALGPRLAATCALLGASSMAAHATEWASFRQPILATPIDVVLPDRPGAAALADAVFAAFHTVEVEANEWREGTPIAAVNAAAGGRAVAVPAGTLALVRRAVDMGQWSDGAFDATWAALWGVWDFRPGGPQRPPQPEAIAARLPLIDFRQVEIDPRAQTLRLPRAGMKLGLGGIAKGWALDRAAVVLRQAGARDFSVSAGGQVLVGGRKEGRPWRVGIRDPAGGPHDLVAALAVDGKGGAVSVSTSGDYEHAFFHGGVRWHHLLDPRTGWPARNGIRSVSVVSRDATLADAMSTAVFVLGPVRGPVLCAAHPAIGCVIVHEDGHLWVSAALRGALVVVDRPAP